MTQTPENSLWRRMVFWLLLPISALQGLIIRTSATKLQAPPTQRKGACGGGKTINLLALGDSIIAGVGASEQEQTLPLQFAQALSSSLGKRVQWHVEGENGADLADLLIRLVALEPETPADVLLLSIGVNDVTGLTSARRWRQQLQLMVQQIRLRWPQALVVFAGLPPMGQFPLPPQPLRYCLGLRAAAFDRIAIEQLQGRDRILHVATEIDSQHGGFCDDGFHPSPQGYSVWGHELARRVADQVQLL